ncbi:anti-sigma regulatory factor [Crocosphaera sp. XPORK-15E]|uniref:ATP-binding protein n=1 Tax=Crocosphaera sp. XPORK-15E TaxID=3110247 RepID=UPI002B20746F|nr:anti-sigma regulatory factor [Crocosphaera sp. XPORK-15E]MEA5532700.1 anti-sigma regulatory factor [Crocosphaera sp. XPORK-15E]
MIAISLPPAKRNWSTMSFTSTLFLCPVLDLLLANIPSDLKPEIRLGLQEALVNAAKHGNNLDPSKSIVVKFSVTKEGYSWLISDEGKGFTHNCDCDDCQTNHLPPEESEHGRGFCLLHEIFDQVQWDQQGTQLKLSKQVKKGKQRQPLLS